MAITLTNSEISRLVHATKPLPADYRQRIRMRDKHGHQEGQLEIRGVDGSEFVVVFRQSSHNRLDFSVILGYRIPNTNHVFRLRRYNGKSHEHTNRLERETFYDFHIHTATERYQDSGFREDAFARPTDTYADFDGAVETLIAECGFERPLEDQMRLFGAKE